MRYAAVAGVRLHNRRERERERNWIRGELRVDAYLPLDLICFAVLVVRAQAPSGGGRIAGGVLRASHARSSVHRARGSPFQQTGIAGRIRSTTVSLAHGSPRRVRLNSCVRYRPKPTLKLAVQVGLRMPLGTKCSQFDCP